MTGESGESSRERQRRLAARAANHARVVARFERRIRLLSLVESTIRPIDRWLIRAENIPRIVSGISEACHGMNRIALRDAPPVTRFPDADSEHVEQRHWPSGVTCTAIFGLLLGYFLGAYFKTPGGTNISRPAMLSCYVTARSPSGNKGGRLQGVDRRRRARTLTLSRDDKFARINFPRLFRISYARHRPAAFPPKKKTDCPNIFIASKRDVQSKQRYVTCIW